MNHSDVTDWFCIRYQDELGLIKGQKTQIISPSMDRELALDFLSVQVSKKKKILSISKNKTELDATTVSAMIQESKKYVH
jgi:hypothetical protein